MRATRQHSNAGICKKQDKTLLALFWRQLISGRLKRWNVLTSLINTFRDYGRGDSFLSTVENSKLNVDFWKQLETHFHGATRELPQCSPGRVCMLHRVLNLILSHFCVPLEPWKALWRDFGSIQWCTRGSNVSCGAILPWASLKSSTFFRGLL